MKKILLTLVCILCLNLVHAQNGIWSVNYGQDDNSITWGYCQLDDNLVTFNFCKKTAPNICITSEQHEFKCSEVLSNDMYITDVQVGFYDDKGDLATFENYPGLISKDIPNLILITDVNNAGYVRNILTYIQKTGNVSFTAKLKGSKTFSIIIPKNPDMIYLPYNY